MDYLLLSLTDNSFICSPLYKGKMLQFYHCNRIAGHGIVFKTLHEALRELWRRKVRPDIKDCLIVSCLSLGMILWENQPENQPEKEGL